MIELALSLMLWGLPGDASETRPIQFHRAATQVNDYAPGRQEQAALAAAEDATFVVWTSTRQEAGGSGIYGRVFDPLARPRTPEVHLNETLNGNQERPAVAALPAGTGAWAAWQSSGPGGSRIAVRGFDVALRPRTDEIWPEESAEGLASSPVIAVSQEGQVLVVWVAHPRADRPGGQIRARLLDPAGRPQGPTLRLSDGRFDSLPTVAALSGERFIVAWADGSAGESAGIRGRLVDSAPRRLSAAMLLAPAADALCPPIEPSVDAAADGRFALAWMQCEPAGYGVWSRRFAAGGEPAGAPLRVAGAESGWKSGAAVALGPAGQAVVSYNSDDSSGPDLWARVVAADGRAAGESFRVSPAAPGRHLTAVASGARRAVWSARGQLAWAWQGTSPGDSYGAYLASWVPAELEAVLVSERAMPAVPSAAATTVTSDQLAPIPPIWNPDFEPQERLVATPGGLDFGFEPILQTPWTPPDPEIAVGSSSLLFMTNGRIASFSKSGTFMWEDEIENSFGFWGELGADNFVFDPEVTWDEHSQRFFAMANERADDTTPYFLLAVSTDSTPESRDDWHKYRWDVSGMAGGALNIDSPNMAVNRDFLFLTADFFGPDKYLLFVVDKASILSGGPAPIANDLIVGTHSMGVPNVRSDTAMLYIVESTELATNTTVNLHVVSDPFGTFTRETFAVTVPTYTFPADPPQSGTSSRPELFEPRFWSVTERNGSIWAVHHVDSTRARVRWYKFALNGWPSGSDPTLEQSGEIDLGPTISTFFPSIDVDAQDTAAITFARSSPTEFISIWRAVRTAADPPNTFQPAVEVQVSANPSTSGRWGDYSGTEADPVVPGSFWGVHEFTNGGNGSWRTWAARYDVDTGLIFVDGFESGDTSAWSQTVP